MTLTERDDYYKYLRRQGFSEYFSNVILQELFDAPSQPDDAFRSDWAERLLKRKPMTFAQWADKHLHYFM